MYRYDPNLVMKYCHSEAPKYKCEPETSGQFEKMPIKQETV